MNSLIQITVDYDAVGAGVDIDELSTVLRGNTAFIYQKAFEKLQKEKNQ